MSELESQSSNLSHGQQRQRVFSFNNIRGIFTTLFPSLFHKGVPTLDELVESLPENLTWSDLFDRPHEYVTMTADMVVTLNQGNQTWLEDLRSHRIGLEFLKDYEGNSPLHIAVSWNHVTLAKSIVSDCPCLLLEQNSEDQLPIHVAALHGHLAAVEALIAWTTFFSSKQPKLDGKGAEIKILNPYVLKDSNGDTPLNLAMKGGYVEVAMSLVNANPESSFVSAKDGLSPFYLAVRYGYLSLVSRMLGDMRDINLEGKKDLAHAAIMSRVPEMLDVILDKCQSVMADRDETGTTYLSFAVSLEYKVGAVNILTRSLQYVVERNDDGSYPIHMAVMNGKLHHVKEILKRCPYSVNLLNKKQQNLLHVAADFGIFEVLSHVMQPNYMCEHLASRQDIDGNTPLHLATLKCRPKSVWCLARRKNMAIENKKKSTALDIAVANLQSESTYWEVMTAYALVDSHGYCERTCKYIGRALELRRTVFDKDTQNALLVVATLMATVTFAAGFTLPGGIKNSPPHFGMANLAAGFNVFFGFVMSDTLGLLAATISLFALMAARHSIFYRGAMQVAVFSLYCAAVFMNLTFMCAIAIAGGNALWYMVPVSLFLVIAAFTIHCSLVIALFTGSIRSRRIWDYLCFTNMVKGDGPIESLKISSKEEMDPPAQRREEHKDKGVVDSGKQMMIRKKEQKGAAESTSGGETREWVEKSFY